MRVADRLFLFVDSNYFIMLLFVISYTLISSAIYDMLQAINKSIFNEYKFDSFGTFKDCVKQATRQYNVSILNECLQQANRDYCSTHRSCYSKKPWVM